MKEYRQEDFQLTKEEIEKRAELQQQMDLGDKLIQAIKTGDKEEELKLSALIKLSPTMASTIKYVYGLDVLKSMGYDLSDVIAEYGEEWLKQEDAKYLELKKPMEIISKMQEELWQEEAIQAKN